MKLTKKERDFWLCKYQIKSASQIPREMPGLIVIDGELDDEYLFYLTSRVPVIRSFDLENTDITNEGVRLISKVKGCESLQLISSRHITSECLADINKMEDLRVLNLLKTPITLQDILALTNLTNLMEMHITPAENETGIDDKASLFTTTHPGCRLFLHYDEWIDPNS